LLLPFVALWSSSAAHANEGRLALTLFGDVGFVAQSGPKSIPTFLLSGLDVFARADLTPRLGFVGEIFVGGLLKTSEVSTTPATAAEVSMPRLYMRYSFGRFLEVRVGRDFTPVGYYQTAYPNNGAVLQTTVERPRVFQAYTGGQNAVHELGLFLHGAVDFGEALTLRYALSTGNGALNSGRDATRWKSFTGRLSFQPIALPGLEFGGSIHYDKVFFSILNTFAVEPPTTGVGAHLVYLRHPLEFIAEYFRLQIDEALPGIGVLNMSALFVQVGWEFGRFTPYTRYEILTSRVPVVAGQDIIKQFAPVEEWLLGLRVRLHEKMVLKVEYGREFKTSTHRGAFQAAFAY
jgi:hypothetical protein